MHLPECTPPDRRDEHLDHPYFRQPEPGFFLWRFYHYRLIVTQKDAEQ